MRNTLLLVCAVALLLPLPSFAEIKVVTHTVQQPFGGSQSPDDARTAGIARAKREALEQFGTYIESTTVVKDSQVDSDEILALTAGVTKAEVLKQKNYTDGDGFGLEITVKVELDTAVLDQSLKRLLQDRNHLKDLKVAREREKQLLTRITELEKVNRQTGKTEKQKVALKREFKKTSQGLTAVDWFDKAYALWDGEKFSDPRKAIEVLSKVIQLDPVNADAYNDRGNAYADLKQYKRAIEDYTQAVKLNPAFASAFYNMGKIHDDLQQFQLAITNYNQAIIIDQTFTKAYINRGITYAYIKKYRLAIDDYTKAIKLNPASAKAYYNRGNTYVDLKQYQLAISDYTQAIHYDPNLDAAYNNRGAVYVKLKQYQQAIADYTQTIHLSPADSKAYFGRGYAYHHLQQNKQAITDYTQAITFDPAYVRAYFNRGLVWMNLGDEVRACRDLSKACKLGDCDGYDYALKKRWCR